MASDRRALVVGNWKMNGLRADGHALALAVAEKAAAGLPCDVALCPPATLLTAVAEALTGSAVEKTVLTTIRPVPMKWKVVMRPSP